MLGQQHQNCPSHEPANVTVSVSNVTYRNVVGDSLVSGGRFMCSEAVPCQDIVLENVNVRGLLEGCVVDNTQTTCTHVSPKSCCSKL